MTTGEATPAADALKYQPPANDEFFGKDYMPAEALTELAQDLIERHDDLRFIEAYDLAVVWRREGGKSGGRDTLGKCTAPSGLTKFYSAQDWVIWLAADHARSHELNAKQVEALLFHELLHCTLKGEDKVPGTVGHDVEAFFREVEVYGLWDETLLTTAKVFGRQLPLIEEQS